MAIPFLVYGICEKKNQDDRKVTNADKSRERFALGRVTLREHRVSHTLEEDPSEKTCKLIFVREREALNFSFFQCHKCDLHWESS